MTKRFLFGWLAVYIINSLTGYIIHDVLLHKTYITLMPVLHTEQIKGRIWAFIITSLTGSFFFTKIYSSWMRTGTVAEGIKYGCYIGLWIAFFMSLNTYAGTGLIPFSLALQWFIYSLIQYILAGALLAFVYNSSRKQAPAASI